ncbi:hypothetical protein CONLIGDRAFT_517283 [Coniochaeta ligniaria NRRL 30616]|uniref:Uncharacterized protein n=1 Tax=Coniochaeta ligniaria NRRL 30616 TaxID=1408157 RepID=A0A1J7IYB1_9PEZI|nr:hypothetical protein CONLIGDRAFT_517283 [Coniochaeta ligniaria NRRL 30616]
MHRLMAAFPFRNPWWLPGYILFPPSPAPHTPLFPCCFSLVERSEVLIDRSWPCQVDLLQYLQCQNTLQHTTRLALRCPRLVHLAASPVPCPQLSDSTPTVPLVSLH